MHLKSSLVGIKSVVISIKIEDKDKNIENLGLKSYFLVFKDKYIEKTVVICYF